MCHNILLKHGTMRGKCKPNPCQTFRCKIFVIEYIMPYNMALADLTVCRSKQDVLFFLVLSCFKLI